MKKAGNYTGFGNISINSEAILIYYDREIYINCSKFKVILINALIYGIMELMSNLSCSRQSSIPFLVGFNEVM